MLGYPNPEGPGRAESKGFRSEAKEDRRFEGREEEVSEEMKLKGRGTSVARAGDELGRNRPDG